MLSRADEKERAKGDFLLRAVSDKAAASAPDQKDRVFLCENIMALRVLCLLDKIQADQVAASREIEFTNVFAFHSYLPISFAPILP